MGRIVGLEIKTVQVETFICPECGKEYKTQENLDKHIAEKHSAEKEKEE